MQHEPAIPYPLTPVETYDLLGEKVELILPGASTGNHSSMIIETSPPGGGPPPHVHKNEDETLFALEGDFEVLCGGKWKPLNPGEFVFLPRGSVHTFRNAGETVGRIVATFFPAGFERFFAEFSRDLTADNVYEQLMDAAKCVGVTFFLP